MDRLIAFDKALFSWLNLELTHPLLDSFMPWVTDRENFFIPLALVGLGLIILGGRKERKALLLAILVLVITDPTSSFLKGQIQRIRPCNIEEMVKVLVGCTHSFSMPSSHAANIFGVSITLSLFYKKLSPLFLFIAFLVAYSRVYVGVHYPSDVVAGAVLGISLSLFILTLEGKLAQFKDRRRKNG